MGAREMRCSMRIPRDSVSESSDLLDPSMMLHFGEPADAIPSAGGLLGAGGFARRCAAFVLELCDRHHVEGRRALATA